MLRLFYFFGGNFVMSSSEIHQFKIMIADVLFKNINFLHLY